MSLIHQPAYQSSIERRIKSYSSSNYHKQNSYVCVSILSLSGNRPHTLDLTLLSEFSTLEQIDLAINKIDQIDLTPLSQCTNFELLDISKNRLTSVDLTPLVGCKELKTLNLEGNKIKDLDLSQFESSRFIEIKW